MSDIIDVAFHDGYKLGYAAGHQVGMLQLDRELVELDARRQAHIHGIVTLPAYADLERRRWDGPRHRFGQPRAGDYPGGPVEWETSRPVMKGTA